MKWPLQRIALALLLLSSNASGQNMLTNPGFETGDLTGWSTFGTGWRTSTGADAHSGTYGVVNDVLTTDSTGFRGIYQNFPASAGKLYSASVYIRTVNLDNSQSWLEVQFLDGSNSVLLQLQQPGAHVTTDQAFTLYQLLDMTAPAGTATISIRGIVQETSMPVIGTNFHIFDDFYYRDLSRTWSGTTDGTWSNASNWGGTAIASGDYVTFNSTSSANLTTVNDVAGLTVAQITIANAPSAVSIGGSAFTLTSGIDMTAATADLTITPALTLGNAQTWDVTSGRTLTVGDVANGGNLLTVQGAGNTTIGGTLSGGGGLTKAGTGTLILSGNNTYAGNNTISGGTLQISSDANLGFFTDSVTFSASSTLKTTGNVSSTRIMTLNGTDTLDIASGTTTSWGGDIGGVGALTKIGAGTLLLEVTGTKNYTGATTLSAGGLEVDGAITASTVTVASGASLNGGGSIFALNNNGLVTPGNSPGTLTINNNYTQSSTGSLGIELASPTSFDKLVVGGVATLNGTLHPSLIGNYVPTAGTLFSKVIDATAGTSVNGTFSQVDHLTPTLSVVPVYNAKSVDLLVQRDLTNPSLNLNPSQFSLATALSSATSSSDLSSVLNTIGTFTSNEAVQNAYNEIAPQKLEAMASTAFSGSSLQSQNLMQRMLALREGPQNYAYHEDGHILLAYNGDNLTGIVSPEADHRWGFFANGNAVFGDQEQTAQQSGYNYTTAGFTLGGDYRLTDHMVLGLASGYSDTGSNLGGSGGKVDTTMITVTPYFSYFSENFYLNASIGPGFNQYDTERRISFDPINRTARGQTDGRELSSYLGGGYDFKTSSWTWGPILSAQYTKLWIDQFTETGADSLNLTLEDQRAESLQTGIGGRAAYNWKWHGLTLIPGINISYQHEFSNDSRGIGAQLAQGSGVFETQTADPKRDFAILGFSLGMNLTENLSANLGYTTEVGHSDYSNQTINGTLRFAF